jgi:hypothetical protein
MRIIRNLLFVIAAVCMLTNCENSESSNSEEKIFGFSIDMGFEEIDPNDLRDEPADFTEVRITGKFGKESFLVEGYLEGDHFLGVFSFLDSPTNPLECEGNITSDTMILEMKKYFDYETFLTLEAVKDDVTWKGYILNHMYENKEPLNDLVQEEMLTSGWVNTNILLESEKTKKQLHITFPVANMNAESSEGVNQAIRKAIYSAFSEDISSDEEFRTYYNEMTGSYYGNLHFYISMMDDDFLYFEHTGVTMDMFSGIEIPDRFIISRKTGEVVAISDVFDKEALTKELTDKFVDLYKGENSLEFQEAKGVFIPEYFIQTQKGVVFLNETGTVFNSAVFMSHNALVDLTK